MYFILWLETITESIHRIDFSENSPHVGKKISTWYISMILLLADITDDLTFFVIGILALSRLQ